MTTTAQKSRTPAQYLILREVHSTCIEPADFGDIALPTMTPRAVEKFLTEHGEPGAVYRLVRRRDTVLARIGIETTQGQKATRLQV
jgi:hypothetical protein